jgi:protein O-GlcNAc transferase
MEPSHIPSDGARADEVLRERGLTLHESGDLTGAEACYREFLRDNPHDPEVNYALGVLAVQTGRYSMAEPLLAAHLAVQDSADTRYYLGTALLGMGHPDDALSHYDVAIGLSPLSAPMHLNRGQALQSLGRLAEALSSFDRAVELRPDFFEAVVGRAETHRALRDLPPAIADYDRAIALRPGTSSSYVDRAQLLLVLRRWADALSSVEQAISLEGATAGNLMMRGMAQQGLKLTGAALSSYQGALSLDPRNALACSGAASMLLLQGRAEESLELADRALSIRQPFPSAWYARGNALQLLGRARDAIDALDRALAEDPHHIEALALRSSLLYARGHHRDAAAGFRQVLTLDPSFGAARMGLAIAQIPVVPATSEEVSASRAAFRQALVDLGEDLESRGCADATSMVGSQTPFALAYQERDNHELLALYGGICTRSMRAWQDQAQLPPAARVGPRSRIRVAIIAAHVHRHSVFSAITDGWIRCLDRARFEVELYHIGVSRDGETERVQSMADRYVTGLRPILEWTALIRERAPDVILYPELGMNALTVQLASQRLAPVQAVSWGHPETSGLPTMDYFLSAESFEPAGSDRHYTERLIRLPALGSYLVPESYRTPSTAGAGVAVNSQPSFVCAGAPFKYAPEYDWALVEIARRVGRCRFHFFSFLDGSLSSLLHERVCAAFSAHGLDPAEYVVLEPWATQAQFHDFLTRADLMLDPLGFSGFNTVMQALECDLPVVTHRGGFLRGRLGAGILERGGLAELIADSTERYVELAVHLCADAATRNRIRNMIRSGVDRLYHDESSVAALGNFLAEAVERSPR